MIWTSHVLIQQARKSSEDTQVARYARFEKGFSRVSFGSKKFGPKIFLSTRDPNRMEIRKCDGREHNGYPAEHNGYPRQTGVGARDTCVSKNTLYDPYDPYHI